MSSLLRSKRQLWLVAAAGTGLTLAVCLLLFMFGTAWTDYDFKVLDLFYRRAVEHGKGPEQSPQVIITAISDKSYDVVGKSILGREYFASLNEAFEDLDPAAVAYDLIFARPGDPDSDRRLAASIVKLGSVFLPIGLAYSENVSPFQWEEGPAYDRFRTEYLRKPQEKGSGRPYYATRALMQGDGFAQAARGSGHITAYSDPDGVFRHMIMLIKVGDAYFPTLSLSMFLKSMRVPFEKLVVEWGRRIVIPALKDSLLDRDVIVPIDDRGRAYIPFPQVWDKAFKKMESISLLQRMKDENLRGNLTEFFEGRFVLVGDVSVGSTDLGQTPLEAHTPLIILHASLLNGLLTNCFYVKWSLGETAILIWGLGVILALASVPRSSWSLYGAGIAVVAGIVGLTWFQFIHFRLFPLVTVGGCTLTVFFGLVTTLELASGKERAFIKNAFTRYVPEKVVEALVANPELLKLGGEERVMTVLFSDLADFTRIAEGMSPARLVDLLMEYLTEMTSIVLANGGIIDKFEGDAIMAEFGAPLPMPDHAERAVRVGLRMQRRLKELREIWASRGLPELRCRVGVSTGPMIVGNMGSRQVFDYTVLGDAVNLASRLEGANKRYNTELIISEATHRDLPPGVFRSRILDVIKVKGKSKAVKVFEVYGEASEPRNNDAMLYYDTYGQAFELYLSTGFEAAAEKFREALRIRPDDPAARHMIERIDALKVDELPPGWDGSIALTTK